MNLKDISRRPLKKHGKLGIPDVYPQELKQKEDELTTTNVKHGFQNQGGSTEEFGTARNLNVTASKVGAYFNAILSKREELMTLPDSGRKKQQINVKDNFWPVTNRTKQTLDTWFKDLAGNKPLSSLAKKAPSFNKKEEIFAMLCENQVTMQRASWFIKLSSAYTVAVSEAKIKKRQMPDPATEWTGTLIKFMKDLLPKLQEYYQSSSSNSPQNSSQNQSNSSTSNNSNNAGSNVTVSATNTVPPPLASPAGSMHSPANNSMSLIPTPATPQEEQKLALKQWSYCTLLSKYMFEEGLLDKPEFLNWIVDLLDKMRSQSNEEVLLKLYLPITLQYVSEFTQNEKMSRKLAYSVAKKLSHLLNNMMEVQSINQANQDTQKNFLSNSQNDSGMDQDKPEKTRSDHQYDQSLSPFENAMNELCGCPQHRDVIIQLSTILQVITLECPTALVWCGAGENRSSSSVYYGSPLDYVPPPSSLPMSNNATESNAEFRTKLLFAEENIKIRSRHAESKWCTDKWQSQAGNSTVKVLQILDALDSHLFDKMDTNNSLDTLYAKIFPPLQNGKENPLPMEGKDGRVEYDPNSDAATVKILCEWAVSAHRWGEHRGMAVARLLDKRQSEVQNESDNIDDKDSDSGNYNCGVPVFQSILMKFLDTAPVLDENGSAQNKAQFKNLVHLFSELIRHDVFSHDAYMCTLISRGELNGSMISSNNNNSSTNPTAIPTNPISSKTVSPNVNQNLDDEMFPGLEFKPKMEEFDDSNVDDDLDKILQHIKEDQQNSIDAPDSPKDPDNAGMTGNNDSSQSVCRHYLYTKHFPLSQDDPASQHDCNQRYILLFGVGKERDDKKHAVKRMYKEICKLFSKKFSIDVAEGGKVKKHLRNEFNFVSTLSKCQSMSYFDQHVVTWQCMICVQEMLNSFAMGNSNYLPVQEHVAFLFDLMEIALNIYGLIDMCIQILKELPDVEYQLMVKNSNLIKTYSTTMSLYVVGILRRYNCCLLLSHEQTTAVFEGLCKVVKHVTNPSDCSSAERCILAYLYDLYSACSILKTKPASEPFHNAYPKIKQTIYNQLKVIPVVYPYNPNFMIEVLMNPKKGGKLEPYWARLLNDNAANRYSFVCNAIIAVIDETKNDNLNDIAITCAELTACCNALSAEWLGAISVLCDPKKDPHYYAEITNALGNKNPNMFNNVAIFACILVARHCFRLEEFIGHVALPAMISIYNAVKAQDPITSEVEESARLTCHIILKLLTAVEYPQPGMYSVSPSLNETTVSGSVHSNIKLSCDRLLLGGAHKHVCAGPILAVLKGILLVADATINKSSYNNGKKSGFNTPVHAGSTPKSMSGTVDLSHILGTREDLGILGSGNDSMGLDLGGTSSSNDNSTSLSEFAQHVMKQICNQEWVLACCLKNFDDLCKSGMLLDDFISKQQGQRLLHMICYPENESNVKSETDQKTIVVRILKNLEQWSLRISLLDLQLMIKQTQPNSPEFTSWLDIVAKAAIDIFVEENEEIKAKPADKENSQIWLISPLVEKLPSAVQGRILKVAGQVLESTNTFGTKNKENSNYNGKTGKKKKTQINHQPFLGLVLTCLKGQDDQKEGLLQSLHSQLSQFLQNKELENVGGIEDPSGREEMLDALQLRFALVGGMFDSIQKSSTSITDWAILLTQLISQGIVDLNNNTELFTTTLDMLMTLIHSTQVSDSQSERDETKKLHTNLMKKLRKELSDKNSPSIKLVRQLLPLGKQTCEVIACEPFGNLTETKGLRITEKQRVSVWDLLEGHKNPAPLSWAWFGAVKMERKPLTYEESHRLLKYHTHSLVKPSSYFHEPLQLPPEDLEPLPEKLKDEKADTPSSVDQSPAGGPRRRGQKRPRKPKGSNSNNTTPNPNQMLQQQLNQAQLPMNPQTQQQMMEMQMNQQRMGLINPNQGNMQQGQGNMSMQMGGPGHMNQNMNYPQNQMQPQNQMMNAGGQMMQGQMMPQNQNNMNFVGGAGPINPMGNMGQQMNQQNPQQWGGNTYNNNMPQNQNPQQQNQQFYPNTMGGGMAAGPGMNQFERPPVNPSKQALSNMLRNRHPSYMPQQNTQVPPNFTIQQQQQQRMLLQQQANPQLVNRQLQQNPQFMRNTNAMRQGIGGKPMNNPVGGGMAGNAAVMNPNMAGGAQVQTPNNQMGGMMQQNTGMMSGGQVSSQMMGNQMGQMGQQQQMMGQQNVNVNVNVGNQMGMGQQMPNQQIQGQAQGAGGQQSMFQNQNQYQGMNQNYQGYNQQGMNTPNTGAQQQSMMNNFNQGVQGVQGVQGNVQTAQRNPQDMYVQQRLQNRVQYMQQQGQQTPNVTMNTNMVGGNMSNAVPTPPYPRQGGKPNLNQSQQAQYTMNQRMRQQQIQQQLMQQQQQQQQQQVMGQGGNQNMGQNPGMQGQQTPALVAQLQRQMPNQQQQMMGQQQQQQQQHYPQQPF